jgi:hypothetical protein
MEPKKLKRSPSLTHFHLSTLIQLVFFMTFFLWNQYAIVSPNLAQGHLKVKTYRKLLPLL